MQDRHCKDSRRKPRAVQKNGDLIELMLKCILAKGYQSMAGSKVKGHATAEDIANGTATAEDAIGNQRSDKAADSGLKQIMAHIVSLAVWFGKRHEEYAKLVRNIHTLIIAMLHANKEN